MTDYIALAREVGADVYENEIDFTRAQLAAFAARSAQAAQEEPNDEQIMQQYDIEIAKGGSADSVIVRTVRALSAAPAEPAVAISKRDADYWLGSRAAIITALDEAGFLITSDARGFKVVKAPGRSQDREAEPSDQAILALNRKEPVRLHHGAAVFEYRLFDLLHFARAVLAASPSAQAPAPQYDDTVPPIWETLGAIGREEMARAPQAATPAPADDVRAALEDLDAARGMQEDGMQGAGYQVHLAFQELEAVVRRALSTQQAPQAAEPVAWLTDDEEIRVAIVRELGINYVDVTSADIAGWKARKAAPQAPAPQAPAPQAAAPVAEIARLHQRIRDLETDAQWQAHNAAPQAPAAQPLTAAEAKRLWLACKAIDNEMFCVEFTRAIESAHGIGIAPPAQGEQT